MEDSALASVFQEASVDLEDFAEYGSANREGRVPCRRRRRTFEREFHDEGRIRMAGSSFSRQTTRPKGEAMSMFDHPEIARMKRKAKTLLKELRERRRFGGGVEEEPKLSHCLEMAAHAEGFRDWHHASKTYSNALDNARAGEIIRTSGRTPPYEDAWFLGYDEFGMGLWSRRSLSMRHALHSSSLRSQALRLSEAIRAGWSVSAFDAEGTLFEAASSKLALLGKNIARLDAPSRTISGLEASHPFESMSVDELSSIFTEAAVIPSWSDFQKAKFAEFMHVGLSVAKHGAYMETEYGMRAFESVFQKSLLNGGSLPKSLGSKLRKSLQNAAGGFETEFLRASSKALSLALKPFDGIWKKGAKSLPEAIWEEGLLARLGDGKEGETLGWFLSGCVRVAFSRVLSGDGSIRFSREESRAWFFNELELKPSFATTMAQARACGTALSIGRSKPLRSWGDAELVKANCALAYLGEDGREGDALLHPDGSERVFLVRSGFCAG